jgi:flavin-binding protein dodecin
LVVPLHPKKAQGSAGAPSGSAAPPVNTDGEEDQMSVAKISEISATSTKSFEDALVQGIARANKTLRNVRSGWIKEQQVRVTKGAITEYQVNVLVTFVIDD